MIKGVHYVRKRNSNAPPKWYVYAWRGGPCVATRIGRNKPILTGAELREIVLALERQQQPDPRQFYSLTRDWRSSPEWKALASSTRRTWESQLRRIEEKWGSSPLSVWSDPRMTAKIVNWRDTRAATPRGADLGVTVLRELLKFGRLRGRINLNAATDVPRLYKGGDRAEIIWTEEELTASAGSLSSSTNRN